MSKAADQAYARIKNLILLGTLQPDDQVKEEEMAERTGLSRTPVRDAMRRLESEMFIRRTDSQRSFVNSWSLSDIEEVFTLRTMLEGHAAERAATRADEAILAALQENNRVIGAAIHRTEPDMVTFIRENAVYHGLILEAAASERLAAMLNRVFLQPIVQRTALEYDRAHLERSLAEHEEVVAAIKRRDPEWARSVMTAHIRRAFHIYAEAKHVDPRDHP